MNTQSPGSSQSGLQLQQGMPARRTPRKIYLWCLLLTLVLGMLLTCLFVPQEGMQLFLRRVGVDIASTSFLPMLCAIIALLYLLEAFLNPVFSYLRHRKDVEDIVTYIQRLRTYGPLLQFGCSCYHEETRTRHVTETYTDAAGNQQSQQRVEYYTERVVTYTKMQQFDYSRCDDISAPLTDEIFHYQYTCIDFRLESRFGDQQTTQRYEEVKAHFIAQNQHRDSGFSFWEKGSLQDFTPKMLSIVDTSKKSPLMHWLVYVLATLLLLSWPYRLWFDRKTVHGEFLFQKRVYL